MGEWATRGVLPGIRTDAEVIVRNSLNGSEARRVIDNVLGVTPAKDFVFPEGREAEVRRKMRRFSPRKTLALFDFDMAMTIGFMENGHEATILGSAAFHLPFEDQQRRLAITATNRAQEKKGPLPADVLHEWTVGPIDLLAQHQVPLTDITDRFNKLAQPRPAVVETHQQLHAMHIPVYIPSAGIDDVVSAWCEAQDISKSRPISTKLIKDDAGKIIDWVKDSLVTPATKKQRIREEISIVRAFRPFTLVIGDNLSDADMVDGEENVLRIRVKIPKPDETEEEKQAYREATFKNNRFDLLLEDGDFTPLLLFLKEMVDNQAEEHTIWPSPYL